MRQQAKAHTVGAQGLTTTFHSQQQASRIFSIWGHQFTADTQVPACFDGDVTSGFFFCFWTKSIPHPCLCSQEDLQVLPATALCFAVLTGRVLQRHGHFCGPLSHWARPKSRSQVTSPPPHLGGLISTHWNLGKLNFAPENLDWVNRITLVT